MYENGVPAAGTLTCPYRNEILDPEAVRYRTRTYSWGEVPSGNIGLGVWSAQPIPANQVGAVGMWMDLKP